MTSSAQMPAADEKISKKSKNSTHLRSPSYGGQASARIERSMNVADILTLLPNAAPIIAQYGLSCFSCEANSYETIEEGCRGHGMAEADIDDLMTDLNELLTDQPSRPQILTLTESAANALKEIMQSEEKIGWGLKVGLDSAGGFEMEFINAAAADDRTFKNDNVPDVPLFASPLTLTSIGGATIDFREGRFKLDLPEDSKKKACACKNGGTCDCELKGGCGCH